MTEVSSPQDVLAEFIRAVDRLPGLTSLDHMLEILAGWSKSRGCIVWEVLPQSTGEVADGSLFPIAQWFSSKDPWRRTDIRVTGSLTGLAIVSGTFQATGNATDDPRCFRDDPWLVDVGPACAFPLQLRDRLTPTAQAAITFFRDKGAAPFSTEELTELESVVGLLPELSLFARDRAALAFLRELDDILDQHQGTDTNALDPELALRRLLDDVASKLMAALRCRQTRIYLLTDRPPSPSRAALSVVAPSRAIVASSSLPADDPGLVTWALRESNPVLVLDLHQWTRDFSFLAARYPGITENDCAAELRRFTAEPSSAGAVLSFVAAPIANSKELIGVVACCQIDGGPTYYTPRDLKLLELVAGRLGPYIQHFKDYYSLKGETDVWHDLVNTVANLNQKTLTRPTGTGKPFVEAAAKDIQRLIHAVDTARVVWADDSKPSRELRSALGTERSVRFSGQALESLRAAAGHSRIEKGTQQLILAPISCGDQFGIVALGSTARPFPEHSRSVAEILGHLLGLYYFLGLKMDQLENQRKQQAQAFSDLRHQIRTPILSAYRFVRRLATTQLSDELRRTHNAIRGLTAQALGVANCVGLFAELAAGLPITLKAANLPIGQLQKSLVEAAIDHQVIFEDTKRVTFDVDRSSFAAIEQYKIDVDLDLYVQCVNCLLDNAGKYSWKNTKVWISGGISKNKGLFSLTVKNRGIPLTGEDAERCAERSWRSDYVKNKLRDTGHGIGLWIVNEIMKSHKGGAFDPRPTTDGTTEFRLVLPFVE